jgi:uncharacterized protein (TIGR00255 family)
MTGFGNAVAEFGSKTISVDIRSLNSKFFDLSLRLPSAYKDKDTELRSELSRELERGKIEVAISIDTAEPQRKTNINKKAVTGYYNELKALSEEMKLDTKDFLSIILRLPDSLNTDQQVFDEEEWNLVKAVLAKAQLAFRSFRENEGKFMEQDLAKRIEAIETSLKQIDALDPGRIAALRKRMQDNLNEHFKSENIDKNRFEQELLFYIEKMDISEEKVRLRTHCDYFMQTMKEDSSGKKLAFISQEMGREINTLGAKANDAGIQKLVVQMKDELEKVKELMMNVL